MNLPSKDRHGPGVRPSTKKLSSLTKAQNAVVAEAADALPRFAAASSSAGNPPSPVKTVMTSRSRGISTTRVEGYSQANAIASSLK